MGYLVEKYGKDKSLYPKDIKKRAIIDQRLHFDSGVIFARGLAVSKSIVFKGAKEISQEAIESIKEAYGFLESLLLNNKWVAGDELSIADFSIVTTFTSWNVLVPYEEAKYPKITAWVKQMEKLSYYNEVNATGFEMYKSLIQFKLSL
ncbi:hypothetical protein NQ314_017310 [Rhamnusium bicolor]|uniref:GST C-terminal domain-containing protein n=1 Tax=Rhamnusium bicolor TaxID=1586634 RepID=A0AAV8WV33_9CUCU|nr:hypothetical protein NQ314_017310 [Rhamnusium bicolor]